MAKLINCKTCRKEISSSVKVCPHCGQKLKSRLFLKIILGTILVLFILMIIGSFAEKSEHKEAQAAASSTQTSQENQKQTVTYTVNELNDMYSENEVRTDEYLKDKTVIIDGTIQEVGKDFTDEMYIGLVSKNQYLPAHMMMDLSEKDAIINLKKGDKIKVHCIDIKYVIQNTTGYKCVIIK